MPEIRLCGCGCGTPIPIASTTHRTHGWVKGQQRPARFIRGHRKPPPSVCGHVTKGFCRKCHMAAHQKAHPEVWRAIANKYSAAHPDRVKARQHRRRARIKGNGGKWTPAEWRTLKRQYGFRCVCCWKTETELKALGRTLSPDHIVSIADGGLNCIENLQPLCQGRGGCNNSKGKKNIDYVIS